MFKEALEYLQLQLSAANRPEPLNLDDPDVDVYAINGECVRFDVPRAKRHHNVFTIDALCDAVGAFGGEAPAVWVSHDRVLAVLDDTETGRDSCVVDLDLHPMALGLLGGAFCRLNHPHFIERLESKSDGVTFSPEDFIARTRTIRFETNDKTESTRNAASDAMGREIRSTASGVMELPKEVKLKLAVMPNDFEDFTETLRVLVRLNATDQNLSLTLPETEAVRLKRNIRRRVVGLIRESTTANVFEGRA